ncbi:MAG TPA: hypothetical protein DIS74_06195 [Bacteroidales bacterium]|nr:hypothetical protein [Bacteroidales bacterium]
MRDFTPETYGLLLSALADQGYSFRTFEEFMAGHQSRMVVLRHDVDRQPQRALAMAELEYDRKITASYHFRVTADRGVHAERAVLDKIIGMGHEVAYHYEDLSWAMKTIGKSRFAVIEQEEFLEGIKLARESFKHNLELLRQYYPVRVISMHGDPLSAHDNRKLWDVESYRDFGIICEPYLDIDYNKVLYLTDTGRRWDASNANRRDRVLKNSVPESVAAEGHNMTFHTTFNLIRALSLRKMPDIMIINTHPQRWTSGVIPWMKELVGQNIRNLIKSVLFR